MYLNKCIVTGSEWSCLEHHSR